MNICLCDTTQRQKTRRRTATRSLFSWLLFFKPTIIMVQIFKGFMCKTLLHSNHCCCCSQAVLLLLKVLSRQTNRCTNNVFDRAISHRSDLGSFYQVMNTLKRLHCFSDQYHHCLFSRPPNIAFLSTLKKKKKKIMLDCRFQQIDHSVLVWREKDMNVDEIVSVISERTSETGLPSNRRSWQSSPSFCGCAETFRWLEGGGGVWGLIKLSVFW